MSEDSYDILILGAGAAGLYAARELARAGKCVALIEARDRVGGRAWTIPGELGAVELGAEFIHGKGKLTKAIAKEANLSSSELEGALYEYRDGVLQSQKGFLDDWEGVLKKLGEFWVDLPVQQFLDRYMAGDEWAAARAQLAHYTEGYYAADLRAASTYALRRELREGGHEHDERLAGGYGPLLEFLSRQAEGAGARIYLKEEASVVHWRESEVLVTTKPGAHFRGRQLLYTLPVGLWQQRTISWDPSLPEKDSAVQQLGYGAVLKVILEFDRPFWLERAPGLGFLFSDAPIPTWWAGQNPNTLVGWAGGPRAWDDANFGAEAIRDYSLQSVANFFEVAVDDVRAQLRSLHYHDWVNDPYSLGAYSFEVVTGSYLQRIVREPVQNTLFFAGEGLYDGPLIGTVEGAFETARSAVQLILAGESNKSQI